MKFIASYNYKEKPYTLTFDADDKQHAESICKQLGMRLDGEFEEERDWDGIVLTDRMKVGVS